MRRIAIAATLLLAVATASGDESTDRAASIREHCADGCVLLNAGEVEQQKTIFQRLLERAYEMGRAEASEGFWNRT